MVIVVNAKQSAQQCYKALEPVFFNKRISDEVLPVNHIPDFCTVLIKCCGRSMRVAVPISLLMNDRANLLKFLMFSIAKIILVTKPSLLFIILVFTLTISRFAEIPTLFSFSI